MNDFFDPNTGSMSVDDLNSLEQIALTYLQEGESIIEIRMTGIDRAEIKVGIIINRKAGGGRKIALERTAGHWTEVGIQGWIA